MKGYYMYKFKTFGTCSKEILFNVNDDIVCDVSFIGGCDGNLSGMSALVEGMNINDVILRLKNIKCGFKDTSCPDQLVKALEKYKLQITNA
jgi:uncharacterized protein (TIGR03905 family)